MAKSRVLKGIERTRLLDELHNKYAHSPNVKQQILYKRKKYSWLAIVGGTKFLKRLIDIFLSTFLLIILSPLFLIIAIIVKVSDGGPVFYVANRVGKWGTEFRFPKFRSMKIGADSIKKDLLPFSHHKNGVTFKMKHDPRMTLIGKILRKTSLDELPQLWCVLKGDMSLVGPRPPLPEEVALYTFTERRRLDVTPGITCIWQVKGRADIPFKQQVQLDLQYIESQSIWLDFKLLLKTIPAVLLGKGAY